MYVHEGKQIIAIPFGRISRYFLGEYKMKIYCANHNEHRRINPRSQL